MKPTVSICFAAAVLIANFIGVSGHSEGSPAKDPARRFEASFKNCLRNSVPDEDAYLLCRLLRDQGLIHLARKLQENGIQKVDDFWKVEHSFILELFGSDFAKFKPVFNEYYRQKYYLWHCLSYVPYFLLFSFVLLAFLGKRAFEILDWMKNTAKRWSYIPLANRARVTFHSEASWSVESTASFTVEFFRALTGNPYRLNGDEVRIAIKVGKKPARKIVPLAIEYGKTPSEEHQVKVTFRSRKPGECSIEISIGSQPIKGSVFKKRINSGPPEPSKTRLVRPLPVVCTAHQDHELALRVVDQHGNACDAQTRASYTFSAEYSSIHPLDASRPVFKWRRSSLHATFNQPGIYSIKTKIDDAFLKRGKCTIVVLPKERAGRFAQGLKSRTITYKVHCYALNNGDGPNGENEIVCCITPTQVAFKARDLETDSLRRLSTFRLNSDTKLTFRSAEDGELVLSFHSGEQKVEITSPDDYLIAATFFHYLEQRNYVGSEEYVDREQFFYVRMQNFHRSANPNNQSFRSLQTQAAQWRHGPALFGMHWDNFLSYSLFSYNSQELLIDRRSILQSSMEATKLFRVSQWCKNFHIKFLNEEGIDMHGVGREWIELLCSEMFDPSKSGMFVMFNEDDQAFVHPNPRMPAGIELKHYEFAGRIVGKCLYESSKGPEYRQLVKARFTRSFLAQLVGLRVTYTFFMVDDPLLYQNVAESDVTGSGRTFAETVYDGNNRPVQTVDLIPGGCDIEVNNDNKFEYLQALADYRLVTSVKEQVEAFLRGLHELVPDHLLSIFDDNELELLMCGLNDYSVEDLRNHCSIITDGSDEFDKTLGWFWEAVDSFEAKERSRLLRFITGSSHLPAGGFAELDRKITIRALGVRGGLPMAQTCIRELRLPIYESYEKLEDSLKLAIDNCEGFNFY